MPFWVPNRPPRRRQRCRGADRAPWTAGFLPQRLAGCAWGRPGTGWLSDRREGAAHGLDESGIPPVDWATPAEVKETYGDASILKYGRVVFNIGGNKFRLVVRINYPFRVVYIRFVGTHAEYDEIDAETI